MKNTETKRIDNGMASNGKYIRDMLKGEICWNWCWSYICKPVLCGVWPNAGRWPIVDLLHWLGITNFTVRLLFIVTKYIFHAAIHSMCHRMALYYIHTTHINAFPVFKDFRVVRLQSFMNPGYRGSRIPGFLLTPTKQQPHIRTCFQNRYILYGNSSAPVFTPCPSKRSAQTQTGSLIEGWSSFRFVSYHPPTFCGNYHL